MTRTCQISCVIFIVILASGCHGFIPLQQTLTLPQQPPPLTEVILIQENTGGTSSDGINPFAFPIVLAILASGFMMIPTIGPDGSMMTMMQALMMAPQPSAPVQTTPSPPQTSTCVPRTCPTGYSQIQNKCYRYFSSPADWGTANVMCKASGADLWEPTTAAEYTAVRTQFNIATLTLIWTGANDIVTEGNVRFIGSNNVFSPAFGSLSPAFPNTSFRDCVVINIFFNGVTYWSFDQCTTARNYVCEYAVGTCY